MIDCSPETLARYHSYYTSGNKQVPQFAESGAPKRVPDRGALPLWAVYRGDTLVAYIYGCFHGQRLMTPHQEQLLRSTQHLFIEHDFWGLNPVTQRHLVDTYGTDTDERRLNDYFYQTGRQITALDKFGEFRQLEDRYTQYVQRHIDSLSRQHTDLCGVINAGQYGLNQMRSVDEALAPEMRDFLDARHKKWLSMFRAATRSPISVIVGLGHVYPIVRGLESKGLRFEKVL